MFPLDVSCSPSYGRHQVAFNEGLPVDIACVEGALSEISRFVDQYSQSWDSQASSRTLFHYTSPDGLIGIVTGKVIWASDMLSLNDASEAAYPYRVIEDVLDANQPDVPDEYRNRFKTQLEDYTFRLYTPFVACFSEEGDLLSQWRAYGEGGEGFALAFNFSWFSSLERDGFRLQRVIYERARQEDLIVRLLQRVSSLLGAQAFSAEEQTRIWQGAAASLAPWIIMFKDPAFSEEREWRLVNHTLMRATRFRRSGHRIVPYLEIPIAYAEAISGVVRGPYFANTDPRGLYYMMVSKGFVLGANIRDSKIPLRK
jgi:hypothetical protein